MWAITLLHNVDTLEVYEYVIRQTEAELQQTTNQQALADMGAVEGQPLTHDLDQPKSTSATTQTGAGPGTRHPRPTKTTDLAKQQRQLQHRQTVILAAERRKQLGAARAALGLPTIPEDPIQSDPNTD